MRWFVVVVALIACKSSPSDKAEKPEKPDKPEPAASCKVDTDCTIACEGHGNCCIAPCCETAVLASVASADEKYNREHCTDKDRAECPTVGGCPQIRRVTARCRAGACIAEVGDPSMVDISGYDRSCAADTDCAVVQLTRCDKCGCAHTPIAAKEKARFAAALAATTCTDEHDNRQCGECMESKPACDHGTCVAR